MRITSLFSSVFIFLVVSVGAPVAAQADPGAGCMPGTPDNVPATTSFYDPARQYLGPDPLPADPPVGPLLGGYQRFGAQNVDQFVAQYRSDTGWIYPPDDGFVSTGGQVQRHPETIAAGKRIDRFGYAGGRYLAPAGDAFSARALPPQNLNSPGDTPLANYHLYCVLKPFQVEAGPIAPWFGQPGGGTQYMLTTDDLPEAGNSVSVTWLLQNGYLVEERPSVLPQLPTGSTGFW